MIQMDERTKLYFPEKSKNENSSTASLFEARSYYKTYSIPYIINEYTNVVVNDDIDNTSKENIQNIVKNFIPMSDLYNENAMYGLVDPEGDVIIPLQNMDNFKSVGYDKEGSQLYLQNFLADAFKDMVDYLNKQILKNCYALGGIPEQAKNSPFYNLSVKKAYTKSTDINKLYTASAQVIGTKFKKAAKIDRELNSKITDYRTFTKYYIPFIKKHMMLSPITKSRITCFYNFTTFSSGLIFSIGEYDAGNDEEKYKKLYIDPTFHNFGKACIKFGFRIDKNNPFILHGDLASPALNPYYEKYNLAGPLDVFKRHFKKVFYEDITSLKYFFVDSYNTFLYNNETYGPNLRNLCAKEARNNSLNTRLPLDQQQIKQYFKEYPDTYWMRLYIYLKISELQLDISQPLFEDMVRKANNYIKFGRMTEALKFVNSRFNEMEGVSYFSSLQGKNEVVQQVVRSGRQELIF